MNKAAMNEPDQKPAALELQDITRSYPQAGEPLEILKGVNLTIQPGEIVALLGPSGSGKSTLLHVAGLLEPPTTGSVRIAGQEASGLNDKGRTKLRQSAVGFIYQFHHLLPEFSARENVAIPQMIAGKSRQEANARADELLAAVGIDHRAAHRPGTLSGGEQQRCAIARALSNRPALLLGDEPTGNLDPDTSESVFQMLLGLTRDQGLAALIATHDHDLAARMDKVVSLQGGQLVISD